MSPRSASRAPLTLVRIDAASGAPLHRQIYDGLRDAIVAGRLAPGAQLPPARVIAAELSVSRVTVATALSQLGAEGYVESRERSGTFVSTSIPDDLLTAHLRRRRLVQPLRPRMHTPAVRKEDRFGDETRFAARGGPPRPFRTGLPAVDAFPWDVWARLVARRLKRSGRELADYGDSRGYAPLRAAVASYVAAARGVTCTPAQVFITNGAQQALDLIGQVLLSPGDQVWLEDPGYPGARRAFHAAGAALVHVAVDDDGISVDDGRRRAPSARMVYVTPSHQYPLGMTMSLARRLELLRWAREARAWVVEDDYDSEFRYASRPIASLQGLSDGGPVLYVGTFSKTLFPSLRVGYVVAPEPLVEAFAGARFTLDRQSPTLEQAALADFMNEGHFPRHVRRMRLLYESRRNALIRAVNDIAPNLLELGPSDSGMKVVAWLPPGVSDRDVAARGEAERLELSPVSQYATNRLPRGGLVLGYAAFRSTALRHGVRVLASLVGG
jgi:GntR family transcriptional regulator/MocR family aminotransferase